MRPLIVMTPKSLLRLPAASSQISELESGGFQSVIGDVSITDNARVKRVVICSGKVYYDLETARELNRSDAVAVIRLEQFYPFPALKLTELFATYPNLNEIVWTQEEPQNMGAWTFIEPRLRSILPTNATLHYIGRDASASPATGSYAIHNLEQSKLVNGSLTLDTSESSAVG